MRLLYNLPIRRDNFSKLVPLDRSFCTIHDSPDGNLDHFRDGGASMFFLPLPVRAALGLDDRLVEKIRQIVGMDVGPQDHIAAAPAVAAVRATARHEFFAPKTDAAPSAVTGLGKNFDSIDKHKGASAEIAGKRTARWHCLAFLSSRA